MSLEHWAWLGIAAQPGNKIVDDILRVFPDPEEFFLSGDSGIEIIHSDLVQQSGILLKRGDIITIGDIKLKFDNK